MFKRLVYISMIAFFMASMGCEGTHQYFPVPTSPVVGMDAVRIIVERTNEFGAGACDVEIKDGDTSAGWVASGAKIMWDRPPGGVTINAVLVCIDGNTDFDPIKFMAIAGDTYVVEVSHERRLLTLKSGMNDSPLPHASGSVSIPAIETADTVQGRVDPTVENKALIDLRTGKNWAVVIGISEYQYAGENGLTNLAFADDDALAFKNKLRQFGWSADHIRFLVNERATQRNIMIVLEAWLTKAGPNDKIVLFWAGHGYPDPEDPEKVYFACYDTDINIPVTGFRMDKIRVALEEHNAKHVIVFVDTCHAGKLITRGRRGISVVPKIEKMKREKALPKGWIFMVGADTDRKAIEHTSWTNGAFTHCLIKGLSGAADGFESLGMHDGIVTMRELRAYMNTAMPDETHRVLGVAKHPIITTSTGDPDIWNLTLQAK